MQAEGWDRPGAARPVAQGGCSGSTLTTLAKVTALKHDSFTNILLDSLTERTAADESA